MQFPARCAAGSDAFAPHHALDTEEVVAIADRDALLHPIAAQDGAHPFGGLAGVSGLRLRDDGGRRDAALFEIAAADSTLAEGDVIG